MSRRKLRRSPRELADLGPPERAQHGELVPRPTALAGLVGRRVKHECRLDWYQDKASIDDRQHAAGMKFRRDWLLAAAAPKLVASYGPRVGTRFDFGEAQLMARARVARASLSPARS